MDPKPQGTNERFFLFFFFVFLPGNPSFPNIAGHPFRTNGFVPYVYHSAEKKVNRNWPDQSMPQLPQLKRGKRKGHQRFIIWEPILPGHNITQALLEI